MWAYLKILFAFTVVKQDIIVMLVLKKVCHGKKLDPCETDLG